MASQIVKFIQTIKNIMEILKYPMEKSPTRPLNVNKLIKLPVCIGSNPLYCKNGINIPAIVDVPKNTKK